LKDLGFEIKGVKGKVKRDEGRRRNVRGERWGQLEIKQRKNELKDVSSTHALWAFLSLTCGSGNKIIEGR
jgi:hypothetical protein